MIKHTPTSLLPTSNTASSIKHSGIPPYWVPAAGTQYGGIPGSSYTPQSKSKSRFKLTIEYDGTNFCGWQRQPNGLSVQEALETALGKFINTQVGPAHIQIESASTQVGPAHTQVEPANTQVKQARPIELFGASRTDAGVHAWGQVAHFDVSGGSSSTLTERTIVDATNFHLRPHKIAVIECSRVSDEFHARFSSTGKLYRYEIINRHSPPPLDAGRAWHVSAPLDVAAMRLASELLTGTHDFIGLQTSECQAKSTVRTIYSLEVRLEDNDHIVIEVRGPAFIHKMVRNLVGLLKMVGVGKWTLSDVRTILRATEPVRQRLTAPAHGLYLVRVFY